VRVDVEEEDAGRERPSRAFLPALLSVTAALKVALAWSFPGFLSGDDLEIVETAAHSAVHLDYEPWAIRSLFHPLALVFPVMKAGALAGLSTPRWLTLLAVLPTIAFSTLGVWLAHRAARALGASEGAARVAAYLTATAWVPFAYGATPFPRPISSALLLGAFVLVTARGEDATRGPALAGVLTAAAFAVRWSEGLAILPLAVLAFARDGRARSADPAAPAAPHLAGFYLLAGFAAGVLVFVGLFDALTWGAPFASLRAFVAYLRAPHPAAGRPPWWYLGMILQWAGPVLVLLGAFSLRDRRAREPLLVAAAFVALLSPSPLKGVRYLMFAVLLLAVAAAFGWERLRGSGPIGRAVAAGCLVLAAPYCAERTLHLMRQKSQPAIEAARFLAAQRPPVRSAALEQAWAYGERLYLGNGVSIADVLPARPLDPAGVLRAAHGRDAVAVYERDASPALERGLAEMGFRRSATFRRGGDAEVVVYLGR
jgi:predicted secreted protein